MRSADLGRALHLEEPLHQALAVVVARVRLAREQDLHRPLAAEQPQRAVEVAQQQVQALVGGHAAREADGEPSGSSASTAART